MTDPLIISVEVTPDLKRRFFKCVKESDSGCWNWTGCKPGFGYGIFRHMGRNFYAHRMSWIIYNGNITDKSLVIHSCDNPACVNPEHLSLGNSRRNHDDAMARNRTCFGSKQHLSKLDDRSVEIIRILYNELKFNTGEIARLFKMHRSNIRAIVKRVTWKRVA